MRLRKSPCRQHSTCQIADLLFAFRPRPRYLAMFYAYFDEAGHPSDSDVVSVAAVVSEIEQWHAFDEQWNNILRLHEVRGLHMTDYESRQEDFRHWKHKDPKAIEFIRDLTSVLINTIQYGCVCSLAMDDWNETMRDRFENSYERKRASLIVLLQSCLEQINNTNLLPKNQKVVCLFEQTAFLKGAIPGHFANWKKAWGLEERFGTFSFDEKYACSRLQGADMLAYEGRKHYLNQWVLRNGMPERKLHRRLVLSNKITFGVMDRQTFLSYLQAYAQHFLSNEGEQP